MHFLIQAPAPRTNCDPCPKLVSVGLVAGGYWSLLRVCVVRQESLRFAVLLRDAPVRLQTLTSAVCHNREQEIAAITDSGL